jgi:hypothetical protein
MTPAERAKAQRDRTAARKAARRCVQCDAGLTPEDGVRCVECAEQARLRSEAYRKTPGGKAARARWSKDRYHARRADGLCVWCANPAEPGKAMCTEHLATHAALQQLSQIRKEEGVSAPPVPEAADRDTVPAEPEPEPEPTLERRVLRIARYYDQVANLDVREYLGLPDDASNKVSALFGRLARKGYLEPVGRGSDAAYRLTDAGRSAA